MRGRATGYVLAALALAGALAGHAAEAPFRFEPPPPLNATGVQRALLGNTHTYHAADATALPRMTITTMPAREIDQRFGALSGRGCINLFLGELERTHTRFFVASQARPLAVAGHALTQFRWSGEKDGRMLTGVLSCGRLGRHYYVFDFVDE
ncbi:MAG: hypothetical protein RLW62_11435, partial [Gammaproteobacteria bacterium]